MPLDRFAATAMTTYGSSNGHDMWICSIQATPKPINENDTGNAISPALVAGNASRNPTKNTAAPGRMYDVLIMCAENWSVHGTIMIQPQTSQRGNEGRRLQTDHASTASAPNEHRLRRTIGDSGTGNTFKGTLMSNACRAPGISLSVHTTSGPK